MREVPTPFSDVVGTTPIPKKSINEENFTTKQVNYGRASLAVEACNYVLAG
jgi:hypothetical protein